MGPGLVPFVFGPCLPCSRTKCPDVALPRLLAFQRLGGNVSSSVPQRVFLASLRRNRPFRSAQRFGVSSAFPSSLMLCMARMWPRRSIWSSSAEECMAARVATGGKSKLQRGCLLHWPSPVTRSPRALVRCNRQTRTQALKDEKIPCPRWTEG